MLTFLGEYILSKLLDKILDGSENFWKSLMQKDVIFEQFVSCFNRALGIYADKFNLEYDSTAIEDSMIKLAHIGTTHESFACRILDASTNLEATSEQQQYWIDLLYKCIAEFPELSRYYNLKHTDNYNSNQVIAKNNLKAKVKQNEKRLYNVQFSYFYGTDGIIKEILAPIDIVSDSEESNLDMPLKQCLNWMIENNTSHIQLIGEGGMGKTSSLLLLWSELNKENNSHVPIANLVSLNEVNNIKDDLSENYLLKKFASGLFCDGIPTDSVLISVINELSRPCASNSFPEYAVLLDGFNEISYEFRHSISKQIAHLMRYPNLAIIVTSRYELNENQFIYNLKTFRLQPLSDSKIKKFLQRYGKDLRTTRYIIDLVRTPMMLTIFCESNQIAKIYSASPFIEMLTPVRTRGEIISNYLESLIAQQHMRQNEIVIDLFFTYYILPYIGFFMEQNQLFQLTKNNVYSLIEERVEKISNDENRSYTLSWFKNKEFYYEWQQLGDLEDLKQKLKQFLNSYPSVFIIKDNICFFTHQNYRDFLSSRYFIMELKKVSFLEKGPFEVFDRFFSPEIMAFVGNVLKDYNNAPKEQKGIWTQKVNFNSILHQTLFFTRNEESSFLIKKTINTILQIWKISRGGIIGEKFNSMDFRDIVLYPLINGDKYPLTVAFDNCKIYKHNFFPEGHTGSLNGALYSPNGQRIVTYSQDKTACIWDSESAKMLYKLSGHGAPVNAIDFNYSGTLVATSSVEKGVMIWDVATGEIVSVLDFPSKNATHVSFHPKKNEVAAVLDDTILCAWNLDDEKSKYKTFKHQTKVIGKHYNGDGNHLITICNNSGIYLWDSQTADLLHSLEENIKSSFLIATLNPLNNNIAVTASDYSVNLWDENLSEIKFKLTHHKNRIRSICYSPNGQFIATACDDFSICIWDAGKGTLLHVLEVHVDFIYNIVFSPNNHFLAVASNDATATIWDIASGQLLHDFKMHDDAILTVNYSPDGRFLLTASDDSTARVWDTETGICVHILDKINHATLMASFNLKNDTVLTASHNYKAKEWSIHTGKQVKEFNVGSNEVTFALYSPDGRNILVATFDSGIKVYDSANNNELFTLHESTGEIFHVEYSKNGNYILTALSDGTVFIWKAQTGEKIQYFDCDDGEPVSATFSNNSMYIGIGHSSGIVCIWDVKKGLLLREMRKHKGYVGCLEFSPDDNYIVSGGHSDHCIYLWDLSSGVLVNNYGEQEGAIRSISFSPDGKRILFTQRNRLVKILESNSIKVQHVLEGHASFTLLARFSPDGSYVVTASQDKTIKIWDANKWICLNTLVGHIDEIKDIRYSSDGRYIVSASLDGTARIWKAENGEPLLKTDLFPTIFDERFSEHLKGTVFDGSSFDNSLNSTDRILLNSYYFND